MSTNPKLNVSRKPLYGMFTDIPPRYDLINRLITWGLDKGWRNRAARECLSGRPQKFLDLCCGTGDLAVTVARLADYPMEIKGLDYSQPMLDLAAQKAVRLKNENISFVQGDASKLPFEDGYFDCVGVSFAFRNLTYKNSLVEKHLSEIVRVLRPGGRCVIAESSQPHNRVIRALDHFYFHQYVRRVGGLLSGNKPAYRYLADSATAYFSPEEMKIFLLNHGFRQFSYKPLLLGAAAIYTAEK